MRATIGILAIVLLGMGLAARGRVDDSLWGGALRVGVLMGVWWLAYPQLGRLPRWLAATLAVALLVVLRWPKLLLLAIPLVVVLWLLRPRVPRDSFREPR
jgi:hypothetical protein